MGMGLMMVVPEALAEKTMDLIRQGGEEPSLIGRIVPGEGGEALVPAAFFAGAFLVAVLVPVFFGAAALLVVAAFLAGAVFGLAAAFFAAGLESLDLGAASLTGPEEPVEGGEVSDVMTNSIDIKQIGAMKMMRVR